MHPGQYHLDFVSSPPEWGAPLRIWQVSRLWELAADLQVISVPILRISDLERVGWYGEGNGGRLTVREVARHAARIHEADLSHPVLLSTEGFLFDGLHRLARAWLEGRTEILAKQFLRDPAPDRIDTLPDWLPLVRGG